MAQGSNEAQSSACKATTAGHHWVKQAGGRAFCIERWPPVMQDGAGLRDVGSVRGDARNNDFRALLFSEAAVYINLHRRERVTTWVA